MAAAEPRDRRPQPPYIVAVSPYGWRNHRAAVAPGAVGDPALLGLVQQVKVERRRAERALPGSSWKHCHRAPTRQPPAARTRGLSARPRQEPAQRRATREKFHSLADPRLDKERASTVLETGWRLDALDDAGAILRLLAL